MSEEPLSEAAPLRRLGHVRDWLDELAESEAEELEDAPDERTWPEGLRPPTEPDEAVAILVRAAIEPLLSAHPTSRRRREALVLMALDLSDMDIAFVMGIEHSCVRKHIAAALDDVQTTRPQLSASVLLHRGSDLERELGWWLEPDTLARLVELIEAPTPEQRSIDLQDPFSASTDRGSVASRNRGPRP
jgi:hypothetical protein